MSEQGIVVGCDQKQEWLLPWWWEHYSCHNSYPVAFVDFGMSPRALDWCSKRGLCIDLPPSKIFHENDIHPSQKDIWEDRYGKGIWFFRSGWFKKPLALLHSPFSLGLWLDLDCQVNGPLEALFNSLAFDAEIGMVREPFFIQEYEKSRGFLLPGEINYNAGVIIFRQNAKILHHWVEEAIEHNEQYVGDQAALNRAVFIHKPSLIELPIQYNWPRALGLNQESIIYHFSAGSGKIEILKKVNPSLLHLISTLTPENFNC